MKIPERIAQSAISRIKAAESAIDSANNHIQQGAPLQSEPERERAIQRVAAVAKVSSATAARIVDNEKPATLGLTGESLRKAEAIQGKTADYIGVAWLEAGRIASNAVARIVLSNDQPLGTGFLVSNRLLLTNNHVISDKAAARGMIAEFRYEITLGERFASPIRFAFDPDTFFETDETDDLDFTLIALGNHLTSSSNLLDFGCCPLSSSSVKHTVGEVVNIVQHPEGDYKQIVIRENRIVHRGDTVLHYVADTEPGASGSPVFNDEWQVIALHHWGAPHREPASGGQSIKTDVNEGIRISAIVTELQQRMASMNSNRQQLVNDALRASAPGDFGTRKIRMTSDDGPQFLIPITSTNNVSGDDGNNDGVSTSGSNERGERGGGAPANRIDRLYSNRRGYNERFLSDFSIPMPQLNATHRREAARVSGVGELSNPFELKYQHFSVVLNAKRRMAFYSICNIDGAKRFKVDRETGRAVSGPEATETWAIDPRVSEEVQLSDAFYARLRKVLRTPEDFFARGHLTRREDPNWGRADIAERANDDTFHHTNACPQVQNAFNGSQKAWQGIENFILNSTDDSNLKVTVITGPVFSDEDPVYEDEEFGAIALPQKFWKVVARVEDGRPIVFAVLADQREAMDKLFAGRRESSEAAFDWPQNLSKEYISTVKKIGELTGLDFGNLVNHDIFGQEGQERLEVGIQVTSPEVFFPRRFVNVGEGFGSCSSIGEFLMRWEQRSEKFVTPGEEAVKDGAERRKRSPHPPQVRIRKVVEIDAKVTRVFADDLSGAKHQQFTVVPTKWIDGDTSAKSEVEAAKKNRTEVRIAVRFGDSRGLSDRIPGIRSDVELQIKGEWISASDAFDVGGEDIPVLHFTHDPLGFICTPDDCFS